MGNSLLLWFWQKALWLRQKFIEQVTGMQNSAKVAHTGILENEDAIWLGLKHRYMGIDINVQGHSHFYAVLFAEHGLWILIATVAPVVAQISCRAKPGLPVFACIM